MVQKHVQPIALLLSTVMLWGSLSGSAMRAEGTAPAAASDAALSQGAPSLSASVNYTKAMRAHVLGPNDILEIQFSGAPQLNQSALHVRPDGRISMPSIGSVEVLGLTIEQLTATLEDRYKAFLKNPSISVNISRSKPFLVYVTGAVLNPGSYEMNINQPSNTNRNSVKSEVFIQRTSPLLSNVLVAAGGISFDADLENVTVKNSLTGESFQVNLMDLLAGDSGQDFYLAYGDSVVVPRLSSPLVVSPEKYKKFAASTFSPVSVPVKVYGFVNQPGLIRLDPAQSLNINSAVTAAGGYILASAYAPTRIYLSRADQNGKLVTTIVNPKVDDVTLMPNDVLFVPDKVRSKIGRSFDYMTRLIAPAQAFGATYNNWALIFNPTRLFTGN